MSRKDKRTGNWYYRKWVRLPSGKRERIFGAVDAAGQPFKKKSDCDSAEQAAIEKLRNPEKQPAPTFHDWFHGRFWTERVLGAPRGANSPSEQESKVIIYGKWLRVPFGSLTLDRIDGEVINTFRAYVRGLKNKDGSRQVAEKTLNNILAVLSTPLHYAAQCGIIARAPHVGVAKVERPEIEWIDFHQVSALVSSARVDERSELYIATLLDYEGGLRIGEIRELRFDDVDMRARIITVCRQVRNVGVRKDGPGSKPSYQDVVGPPKGRKRRTVPMTPAVYEALRGRLRTGFVVSNEGGQRVSKEVVRCGMDRIAKRAGLEGIVKGWHIGRHTFALHAAMLGINPWDLNQRMGHASMAETMRYADLARAQNAAIPPELIAAGETEADPGKRILAQLSARLILLCRAATGQRRNKKGPRPL